ncbi:hypothetical protein ColLi_11681 [Colletotrichum liriopes]|uniref:Necrosis inducing protein n=1 Tax=Colletotrichum liriopes TaxID=708192 RepID=A0AA37LYV0_9PEZI|nr:hypothetical protein ColLi_11681 [Colletotrichum liriopes]
MAAPTEQPAAERALQRRAGNVINHDVVRGFDTATSDDYYGRSFKLFQPLLLSTSDSCYSYPAVDPNGDYSGGLQIGGSQTGDCRDSAGQTYVRGRWWNDKYAIMYAWYFPKDQNWIKIKGHRHDWEHVVVWINNPDDRRFKPELIGVSTSFHSGYKNLDLTGDDGGMSRLIQWELMTPAAQDSLKNVNWGDANFPMGGNFEGNLGKAWPF